MRAFERRRRGLPRKGQPGRPYDENGVPMAELPSDERPKYTNDEYPGLSLKENDPAHDSYTGEITGRNDLFPAFGGRGKGKPEGGSGARGVSAASEESETETEQETAPAAQTSGSSDDDYDFDVGLSEYYDRLYNRLRAYGVTSIPSFDALYAMFESFLRPSIDEAIRQRNRQGAYNMAELDADAYARGMGGSSYLSSMKAREQDDVRDDVMGLEAKYTASMAEYLYNALTAMQELEASLARTSMQIAASQASHASSGSGSGRTSSGSGRSSGSSSSGSSSQQEQQTPWGHNKNGSYFDGVWYEGDFSYMDTDYGYYDYAAYIEGLSAWERYLLFTSDKREWRMRRWQMQYNLTRIDYDDLYNEYFTTPGSGGGGGGGGGGTWHQTLY